MPQHGSIAYEVFGRLNAAADNCVLVPSYYGGTSRSYLPLIGPGRALDPERFFIVLPNMLGNGVSNSPSNSREFQQASLADNVHAQHALLNNLGVRRIALAYGWSMGAMQGFAWASLYPDMVRALLAVCGTAKCWPLNYVFLEGVKAAMGAGKKAFGRAYAGWAYSAAFYREELWRGMGFANLEDFLRFWENDHEAQDARDLLAMLHTWQTAKAGPEDLTKITARVIAMPCDTDMYFCPEEAAAEVAMIQNAELRVLTSPYGHCAGAPGRFTAETARVETAMRELLADIRMPPRQHHL
ncbi:MAG: alpha/beta fold hydrolase [Acidocella sp.]|nr:alpha/beta fold hydrolase [Acidocella sp.]